MRSMKTPGFTADAAVYVRARRSLTVRTRRGGGAAGAVKPAAAIYMDGRYVCDGEVNEHGFIACHSPGGGGHTEPPELVCGPCIRGRQRCGIPGVGFAWGPCLD